MTTTRYARPAMRSQRSRRPSLSKVDAAYPLSPDRHPRFLTPVPLQFRWAEAISTSEWATYRAAMQAVRAAQLPFLLGGGFALATFIGHWRDTKDIDFYIMPEAREKTIAALTRAGFADYYAQRRYDRKWIYRSVRDNVIVDIIWSMANQRAQVDDLWFKRAGSVVVRGEKLGVLPMEEFTWCKLYIVQRDHCDWTDIFNLFHFCGQRLDWAHLIWRLREDIPLLKGALTVYSWLCPGKARELPSTLWRRLRLDPPSSTEPPIRRDRVRFLDSRAWFAATKPKHAKLEV